MNYDSAIEDLTKLLQDNYDKKIQDMVLNICQKTPISLVTPKIDSNGDIVMVRFLRNITIKKRFGHRIECLFLCETDETKYELVSICEIISTYLY
jgi:hypothetical protein